MAELKFYIDGLHWREVLALLHVCESARKDSSWPEMLATFAVRIANLGDANRHEILCSHLQSVEDLDVYDDEVVQPLVEKNRATIDKLARELESDKRFA